MSPETIPVLSFEERLSLRLTLLNKSLEPYFRKANDISANNITLPTHVRNNNVSNEFELYGSVIGADRPITALCFVNNEDDSLESGSLFMSGSMDGVIKAWSLPSMIELASINCNSAASRIDSFAELNTKSGCASHAQGIELFRLSNTNDTVAGPLLSSTPLVQNISRCPRVIVHSSLFACSNVKSSGPLLFDLSSSNARLVQRFSVFSPASSAAGCYGLGWHPRGALLISGIYAENSNDSPSIPSMGNVWDLRLGKSIWSIVDSTNSAHPNVVIPNILCAQFVTDWLIIMGGIDGMLQAWDMRQVKKLWTVPAHAGPITQFIVHNDKNISSCSFDGLIKNWYIDNNLKLVQVLQGHDGKVTCLANNDKYGLLSGSFDRTIKLWTRTVE